MSKNPPAVTVASHNIVRTEADVFAAAAKRVAQRQKAGPNVGPNAKRGEANRKQLARLRRRMVDYSTFMGVSSDPTGRKGSGGFKRPGSMQ